MLRNYQMAITANDNLLVCWNLEANNGNIFGQFGYD